MTNIHTILISGNIAKSQMNQQDPRVIYIVYCYLNDSLNEMSERINSTYIKIMYESFSSSLWRS